MKEGVADKMIHEARKGRKFTGKTTAKRNSSYLYEVKKGEKKMIFGIKVRAVIPEDKAKPCMNCPFFGTVNCADIACLPFQRKDHIQITLVELEKQE